MLVTRLAGVRSRVMPDQVAIPSVFRNLLEHGDLSFRDFMEIALYHPEFGYYARSESPVGRQGDFITSPELSPVFSFALSRLVTEFVHHSGDGTCTIVDVGCGDGSLIHSLAIAAAEPDRARFVGVDRWLDRVRDDTRDGVTFARTIDEIPRDGAHLILSNELFDALPFCRVVQRSEHLHELGVTEREGRLDWSEREAVAELEDYFASRAIDLTDGQFADVSLEWGALYGDICRVVENGLIVTFDYGYPENKLFQSRVRRFGTAAAYSRHRVSRDLLASPGEQDLTAHINFDDLKREGERRGFSTLFFDRQAKFLLALGITKHELFRPSTELEVADISEGVELLERRDAARQLVLPDTIGHDIRVLVQGKGIAQGGWTFELPLF
jgi:SAM-dependent MidA family methyltransferase